MWNREVDIVEHKSTRQNTNEFNVNIYIELFVKYVLFVS